MVLASIPPPLSLPAPASTLPSAWVLRDRSSCSARCEFGLLYINLDNKQLGYLFFLILTSTFSGHVARIYVAPAPDTEWKPPAACAQTPTQIKSFTHKLALAHMHTQGLRLL